MFEKQIIWLKEKWESLKSWWKKQWKKVAVIATTTVLAANLVPTPIPEYLKLKASPDKILYSREILKEKCVKWSEGVTSTNSVCEQTEHESVVKYIYASDTEVPIVEGEDISKRTKNALFFKGRLVGKRQEWTQRAYVGAPFYKDTNNVWYQTKEATTTLDVFNKQMGFNFFIRKVFATTDTDYSGSGDGTVATNGDVVWNTGHDANDGDSVINNQAYAIYVQVHHGDGDGGYVIRRSFLPIDTSGIGADMSITTSTLNIYINYRWDTDNDAQSYLAVVQTSQPSETGLTTADFDLCGAIDNPTKGSNDIDVTGESTGAYTTWTLNAAGRGWIKKSGEASNCGVTNGWTCLGVREGHDIEDLAIDEESTSGLAGPDSEKGTNDPYLETTYTVLVVEEKAVQSDFWYK